MSRSLRGIRDGLEIREGFGKSWIPGKLGGSFKFSWKFRLEELGGHTLEGWKVEGRGRVDV